MCLVISKKNFEKHLDELFQLLAVDLVGLTQCNS